MRARVRVWEKFRRWLLAARGRAYPEDVKDTIAYVQELEREGCGKTVPGSFAAALCVIEEAGGVPLAARLSQHPTWMAVVGHMTAEGQHSAPPVVKARPFTIAMVISLELAVLSSRPAYQRALAWVRLVKVWGCMRCSDLMHASPQLARLDERALTLVLSQTKTTGPGKRTGAIRAYVHRQASLSGKDWLLVGWNLWQTPEFSYKRDYLVPRAAPCLTRVARKMAEFVDMAGNGRALLGGLGVPVWDKKLGWHESEQRLLPGGTCNLFSEHSERHVLPTLTAQMGVAKDRRDCLGRWNIQHSTDYAHAAKHTVLQVQEETLKWLMEARWHPHHKRMTAGGWRGAEKFGCPLDVAHA